MERYKFFSTINKDFSDDKWVIVDSIGSAFGFTYKTKEDAEKNRDKFAKRNPNAKNYKVMKQSDYLKMTKKSDEEIKREIKKIEDYLTKNEGKLIPYEVDHYRRKIAGLRKQLEVK